MSAKLIKKEGYNAQVEFTINAQDFDKFCDDAYKKEKNKIRIEGFRKGKAPRKLIEKMYGEEFFYEDALNMAFNEEFPKVLDELELELVAKPNINIKEFGKGEDVVINVDLIIKPDFEIGNYKGLNLKRDNTQVTEEQINKELEYTREKNARFVDIDDRPIKNMDTIKLDFNGKVDGKEFDGGKAEDYTLVVGSGSFIEGFEPQLIGMSLGDEKSIEVKFPQDYFEKTLAGKPAVFDVKIKDIKERQLPEIDDEFVKDISEFDTLDQLREDIRKHLEESSKRADRSKLENQIVDSIIESSKFDLPNEMIENQIDHMVNDFSKQLSYQGATLDNYLSASGMTIEELRNQMRSQAEKQIKSTMVLDKVKELENVGYSDDQIEEEYNTISRNYHIDLDKVKDMMKTRKQYIIDNLLVKNTLNYLVHENEAV